MGRAQKLRVVMGDTRHFCATLFSNTTIAENKTREETKQLKDLKEETGKEMQQFKDLMIGK